MKKVFIETPTFTTKFDNLANQGDMYNLQDELMHNPEKGKIMQGTGGARKIRMKIGAKGKSGGARIIYYYVDFKGEIWFLDIFSKSEKSNISNAEKKHMYSFIKEVIQ